MAREIDKKLHDLRRSQIIDAAAECFIENGFHQTGMQQICKKVKMGAGSVYHYFANKDEIIEAISKEFGADTVKFINSIKSNCDFIEGYLKAVSASLRETQKYSHYGRLVVEIYAESFRNDEVKQILRSLDQEAITELQTLIKQAKSTKQISSNHDAHTLAHMLIALLEGLEDRVLQNPGIKLKKLLNIHEDICRQLLNPG